MASAKPEEEGEAGAPEAAARQAGAHHERSRDKGASNPGFPLE